MLSSPSQIVSIVLIFWRTNLEKCWEMQEYKIVFFVECRRFSKMYIIIWRTSNAGLSFSSITDFINWFTESRSSLIPTHRLLLNRKSLLLSSFTVLYRLPLSLSDHTSPIFPSSYLSTSFWDFLFYSYCMVATSSMLLFLNTYSFNSVQSLNLLQLGLYASLHLDKNCTSVWGF